MGGSTVLNANVGQDGEGMGGSNGTDGQGRNEGGGSQETVVDGHCRLRFCGGDGWPQAERGEGCLGGRHGRRRRTTQEDGCIQVCRRVHGEAQGEARNTSEEGREPLHERGVCVQGEASVQDRARSSFGQTEASHQLICACTAMRDARGKVVALYYCWRGWTCQTIVPSWLTIKIHSY